MVNDGALTGGSFASLSSGRGPPERAAVGAMWLATKKRSLVMASIGWVGSRTKAEMTKGTKEQNERKEQTRTGN